MICVSIGRGRHAQMIIEHQRLCDQGAKLVELRLDYIARVVDLSRLIDNRPCPVIITCRREKDGGRWRSNETERVTLLRSAIAAGVEYVDLEEHVANQIPRYGNTKRIISLHDFEKTPEDLDAIHRRLAALDPDIIKLATMANNPHDNLRMLRLIAESEIPTVGICMGDMGTPSRILAGKFGAPFTFATFHQERALAPGQIAFQDMQEIYSYDQIDVDTEIYGVIADPIAHSLSPVVHNRAFRHLQMNKVYLPFRVPAENLMQFMDECEAMGIRGLSVTIPHKEEALKFCTKVDGAARAIGAVNTLVFRDGGIHGYNTDYWSAMSCLDQRLGTADRKTPLVGHSVLVLGAGGAARALAFGLVRRGANVVIASRSFARAEDLAEALGCRAVQWKNRHQLKPDVLVNATPIGMHPNVDETPYDKLSLRPQTIVFDTVYNPEQTLLHKEAKHRRCRVISGLEMFVGQAILQFQHFTGQQPPFEFVRDSVKRAIGAARY